MKITTDNSPTSAKVLVHVLLLPLTDKPNSVRISPHPAVTVNETGHTTLKCQASGGNPTLYWYKWKHEENYISGEENATLFLDNIQKNQSGDYSCLGCNMIGCTSNTTTVIVQSKYILNKQTVQQSVILRLSTHFTSKFYILSCYFRVSDWMLVVFLQYTHALPTQ